MTKDEIKQKFEHVKAGYEDTVEGYNEAIVKTAYYLDMSIYKVKQAIKSI